MDANKEEELTRSTSEYSTYSETQENGAYQALIHSEELNQITKPLQYNTEALKKEINEYDAFVIDFVRRKQMILKEIKTKKKSELSEEIGPLSNIISSTRMKVNLESKKLGMAIRKEKTNYLTKLRRFQSIITDIQEKFGNNPTIFEATTVSFSEKLKSFDLEFLQNYLANQESAPCEEFKNAFLNSLNAYKKDEQAKLDQTQPHTNALEEINFPTPTPGDEIKIPSEQDTAITPSIIHRLKPILTKEIDDLEVVTIKRLVKYFEYMESLQKTPAEASEMRKFEDIDLVFEDGVEPPMIIQASLESLLFILFSQSNSDFNLIKIVCIIVFLTKINPVDFFKCLHDAFNLSESPTPFKQSITEYIALQLNLWFPTYTSTTFIPESIDPFFKDAFTIAKVTPERPIVIESHQIPFDPNAWIFESSSPDVIVAHLSLLTLNIIHSIEASEYLEGKWSKPNRAVLVPNLARYLSHFNAITGEVLYSIISETSLEVRRHRYRVWFELLRSAKRFNNRFLMNSIFDGLTDPKINKLAQTKAALSSSEAAELDSFFDITNTRKVPVDKYAWMEQLGTSKTVPIFSPLIGDLTFVNDGNALHCKAETTNVELINVTKVRTLSKLVDVALANWGSGYVFVINKELYAKLDIPDRNPTQQELSNLAAAALKTEQKK